MYYEDFRVGQRIEVGSRLMTDEDVASFVDLVGLHLKIFQSDDGARDFGHPRRLVPGPLQLSVAMGLAAQSGSGLFNQVVAVARFDKMKFLRPAHPGQTLTLYAKVLEKRATSNPTRGMVLLEYEILNDDNQPTLTALGTYLFLRRN